MSIPKKPTKLYFKTLEPVHVGAGGYRLGRVDKTICREPGTNLPKIPGTSLRRRPILRGDDLGRS